MIWNFRGLGWKYR